MYIHICFTNEQLKPLQSEENTNYSSFYNNIILENKGNFQQYLAAYVFISLYGNHSYHVEFPYMNSWNLLIRQNMPLNHPPLFTGVMSQHRSIKHHGMGINNLFAATQWFHTQTSDSNLTLFQYPSLNSPRLFLMPGNHHSTFNFWDQQVMFHVSETLSMNLYFMYYQNPSTLLSCQGSILLDGSIIFHDVPVCFLYSSITDWQTVYLF